MGRSDVSNNIVIAGDRRGRAVSGLAIWMRAYLRWAVIFDFAIAVISSALALQVRFGGYATPRYAALSLIFPLLWVLALWLSGAYDDRYVGIGSDEFRKVLNAGVSLIAGLAIVSYAVNTEISRAYLLLTMPSVTLLDLIARYAMRKRLHRQRALGRCNAAVMAVGPEPAVADLVTEFRRDTHHGLSVVAACLTGESGSHTVAGVPVVGGLQDVADAVRRCGADTVAVLSCTEVDGVALRQLAWELEKTGTDLCVAPALLDVAGPRTTIRPIAGLTLLHVDHPRLGGPRQALKEIFDRVVAGIALIVMAPLLAALAAAIRLADNGPALFTQTRVGKDGRPFKIYKFRTMVVDAEQRLAELRGHNDLDGVLPDEAAMYADHVRRRLVVKPGLTGLWQVSGRSDLSWGESVRLDLRYVENWSFVLDLQILWKTFSVIIRGSGAY
jgi:lipopolysaccharide/colanic/teichoic acid biosynthesis glycosyltransferase